MNRLEVFEREFNMIGDSALRNFAEHVLEQVEPYFFFVPSSSTKKYHSKQSNVVGSEECTGGLVNHTKSTVYFADRLCRGYDITGKDRDIIIIACVYHDCLKFSKPMQRWTTKDHDKEGADFVYRVYKQGNFPDVDKEDVVKICKAISWHFGRFTTEDRRKKFPEEYTTSELIVHLADLVSASKEVNLEFLEQSSLIG